VWSHSIFCCVVPHGTHEFYTGEDFDLQLRIMVEGKLEPCTKAVKTKLLAEMGTVVFSALRE
jgi:hypothetical protein